MTNIDPVQSAIMEQKLRCVDLLFNCPLNRNAKHCPFATMRKEEAVVTRVNWVKSLAPAKLTQLLDLHESCLSQPEATSEPPK